MRDDDATLAAVARKVGYTSKFAFAHAFKREWVGSWRVPAIRRACKSSRRSTVDSVSDD